MHRLWIVRSRPRRGCRAQGGHGWQMPLTCFGLEVVLLEIQTTQTTQTIWTRQTTRRIVIVIPAYPRRRRGDIHPRFNAPLTRNQPSANSKSEHHNSLVYPRILPPTGSTSHSTSHSTNESPPPTTEYLVYPHPRPARRRLPSDKPGANPHSSHRNRSDWLHGLAPRSTTTTAIYNDMETSCAGDVTAV